MMRWNFIRSLCSISEESITFCRHQPYPQHLATPLISLNSFCGSVTRDFTSQLERRISYRSFSSSPLLSQQQPAHPIIEEPQFPEVYTRLEDKRIRESYKIQHKPIFAVVEAGGTQYKVTPDDVIITEKLQHVDVNDIIKLQRVLLVGSTDGTIIGRPYILGATVTAAVEEQFLDGKVIIFHKRRRKNSRRTTGHRQPLTRLRIISVDLDGGDQLLPESISVDEK